VNKALFAEIERTRAMSIMELVHIDSIM